jgi:hypothetical protein
LICKRYKGFKKIEKKKRKKKKKKGNWTEAAQSGPIVVARLKNPNRYHALSFSPCHPGPTVRIIFSNCLSSSLGNGTAPHATSPLSPTLSEPPTTPHQRPPPIFLSPSFFPRRNAARPFNLTAGARRFCHSLTPISAWLSTPRPPLWPPLSPLSLAHRLKPSTLSIP